MKVSFVILVTAISLVDVSLGQSAFPLKPGEVAPLVDPTGKDDPNAPELAQTPPPVANPAAKPPPVKPLPPRSTAPVAATAPDSEIPKYIIASGDSLTKVSAQAYGRPGYWRVLKLYNACDPAKLKIGQVIKTPDLQWLLEQEGIVPLLSDAAESMMKARKLFMEVEDSMSAAGAKTVNDEMKAKILEAQKLLVHAREMFARKREGVTGMPNSTLLQLRSAGESMGKVAQGTNVTANMGLVHERFGNAITYGVLWAREDFK